MNLSRIVAIAAACLLLPALAACGGGSAGAASATTDPGAIIGAQPTGGAALAGTSWVLTDGQFASEEPAAAGITLEFSDTEATGSGGVNRYFAGYTSTTEGSLQIDVIASTAMAGDEAAMTLEQEYLASLQSVFGYTIEGETLTLVGAADQVLIYTSA